ncbi:MAG: methylated-DNA--[protein]-cysteine S-methyltransferase [Methylococcaceae bacterium]|nr:methylated-DNA--[protein]-cysteine S-methyltransferase [Methylococcaceae bacterium]
MQFKNTVTHTAARAGVDHIEINCALAKCSLGLVLLALNIRGVCAIVLGDDSEALLRHVQNKFPQAILVSGNTAIEPLLAKVVAYIEAPILGLDLPIDYHGTDFQQQVWQALREIPVGATVSYAEIAQRIGVPKAARAVAAACAANSLAVIIPCHRVVRRDGGLSGYRWGVARKAELLRREAEI